jgi:uncharacterized membrane protein
MRFFVHKRRIIMDKMIVVVFDSESKAYEGSKALKELNGEGSITLYAMGVIEKNPGGKVTVKEEAEKGPLGTAVGLATGSLIGAFGGPVGMAIGAYAGTLGGVLYDSASAGIGEDFLAEVGTRLQPGKTAVVAEIEEEWVTPVDTRMEALGGVVSRRLLKDVRDELIKRDTEALKAEIAQLKAEHAQATEKAKIRLQAKIDADKARLQAMQDRAKTALEAVRQEMDAKIKSLQEQANKAKGDAKAKREARIAEVRSEYGRRTEKLKQAWELTKQALAA